MVHYFSDNKDLSHKFKIINLNISNRSFKFKTDSGVFSRQDIDFGSFLLLNSLIKESLSGKVLDLGCGYGVIGIVLKSLFDVDMFGSDINSRAIDLSNYNAILNNVDCSYVVSDSFLNIDKKFNHIILNPPIRTGKENIFNMYQDAYNHLEIDGSLWIVIRKKQGAKSSYNKIIEIFNNCTILNKDKGYIIYKASRC